MPPKKDKKDSLFLLEVLVDKIIFSKSPCFSDGSFKTCVNVTAPFVEEMEICDDESAITSGTPFIKNFNSGKSCLFFMKEGDIKSAMSKFIIKVEVFKTLPCGCLPAKIQLGKAEIDMTKEFIQARNQNLQDAGTASYQALQDTFRLIGEDKSDTAEIIMFLRLSCFGTLIVTKFQGGGGPMTLGAGQMSTDRSCNPSRQYQTPDDPCVCGAHATSNKGSMGSLPPPACRGGGRGTCPPARDPYSIMPCTEPDDLCYCTGPHPVIRTPLACRNTDAYCLHIPKGRSKQYEEIGTNLAGNELKIKVPVCSAIIKRISQTHCAIQRPYDKDNRKDDKVKSDGPCDPPCGRNQISLALPSEDVCCRGPQLADTQFTCTTEGCYQTSKHGQQQTRSEIKHQEPVNKDVFVLKVEKTAMQGDRKCKLELELVAPKAGDKRLPVQKMNSRLQSNECGCCNAHNRRRPYCCPPGNKVIFQLPTDTCGLGHRQRAHFNRNSDGIGDLSREEPGQLVPITSEDYSGVVYDFPKQVIKLRVGKTIEMAGRKSKLEYQFITPTASEEKQVPVKDTRTSQWKPCCPGCCGITHELNC